jgi:hypothetical protein
LSGPPDETTLEVAFECDAFYLGPSKPGLPPPRLGINGKVTSDDFRLLQRWYDNRSKLTLKAETFTLEIYLSDALGNFRATGGPVPT